MMPESNKAADFDVKLKIESIVQTHLSFN